jgi:predicted short-subunit dehydrogenase-like oxidoreductase (DUF2520 family)
MRLGIIGGGRAAWAFGSAWRQAGLPLAGIALRPRSVSPAADLLGLPRTDVARLMREAEVIVAAVSDHALPEIAEQLRTAPAGVALFHCSGSLTSAVFGDRSTAFSLHPLRALPAVGTPSGLTGTLLVFEGVEVSRPIAQAIVERVGGRFAEIAADAKPLYHAAAVFGSNYVAALLAISMQLLDDAGLRVDPAELKRDIAELAISAVQNWAAQQGTTSFTGPIVRGERDVVRKHLLALGEQPGLRQLYEALASRIATEDLKSWLDAEASRVSGTSP